MEKIKIGILVLTFLAFFLAINTASAEVNLTVTSINAPSEIGTGEEINITYTVQNQGNETYYPTNNWGSGAPTTIFVSTDIEWDGSDVQVGTGWYGNTNPPIAPGESYSQTFTWICPGSPEGNSYLIAGLDFYQVGAVLYYQVENRHGLYSSPIYIKNPDLVPSIIALDTVSSQQTLDISWTVENQGNGDAIINNGGYNDWADALYLSIDDQWDESDTRLAVEGLEGILSSGSSYTVNKTITIPGVPTGNYYLLIGTDWTNSANTHYPGIMSLYESNESNNLLAKPITILNPDLVPSIIALDTVSSQQTLDISWTVENQGNGDAIINNGGYNDWADALYLSIDDQWDESDTRLAVEGLEGILSSGSSYTVNKTITIPGVPTGNYYLLIGTDWTNSANTHYPGIMSLYESNESNNIFAEPIYICENIWDVNHGDVIQNIINGASPGDVINFHGDNGNPYTYIENLLVDKTLVFQEYGDGEVTLQANDTNQAVIFIDYNGNNTIINGFTITSGSNGIYINGANNCSILNNTITGNNIGILLMGNENYIYNNNVSSNGWAGICLSGVSGNLLECNTVTDNSEGIYILNSYNNALNYNIVTTNGVNGIDIVGGGQNTIINNMVTNNGVSTNGNGVILKDTTGNNLWKNQVNGNGWSGIVLDNSSDNSIWDAGLGGNTINGNGNGLVLFNGCNNNTITGNSITSNLYNGLQLFVDCQYNQVYGNWILNNQVTGMLIQLSDNNNITGNNVTGSSFNGIALESADNNIINTNTITQSGSIGLILVASNNNLIQTNELTSTFWTNIAMDQSNNNLIQGNTINGTGISDNGIWFQSNCNWNNITSNIITENKANGLFIQSSTNNLVNYNKISQNTGGAGMGLLLVTSTSTVINHNTFQDNGWVGTCLSGDSNGNTITENNYISTTAQVSQAFDAGTNTYDNGASGNYWSNWGSTSPRPIDGGSNVDNHPSLTEF